MLSCTGFRTPAAWLLTPFAWCLALGLVQQRDPGRTFVLGERVSYVLLPGAGTQDERAEDPLTAAKAGAPADYELYWTNKLRRPLSEILTTCLAPAQLQARAPSPLLGPGLAGIVRLCSPLPDLSAAPGMDICPLQASGNAKPHMEARRAPCFTADSVKAACAKVQRQSITGGPDLAALYPAGGAERAAHAGARGRHRCAGGRPQRAGQPAGQAEGEGRPPDGPVQLLQGCCAPALCLKALLMPRPLKAQAITVCWPAGRTAWLCAHTGDWRCTAVSSWDLFMSASVHPAACAGTTKCLGCRRAVKCGAGEDPARAPGLCADCAGEEGRLEAVLLELQAGRNRLEARLAATHALCARCHSGGLAGAVLCENGECSVRAHPSMHRVSVCVCQATHQHDPCDCSCSSLKWLMVAPCSCVQRLPHHVGRRWSVDPPFLPAMQVLYARLGSKSRLSTLDQSMRRLEW